MSAIKVEGPMLEVLRGATSGTTLCDPAGNSIGHVISNDDYLKLQYAHAWDRFTDDEIRAIQRQPHVGVATNDLLEALKLTWNTK